MANIPFKLVIVIWGMVYYYSNDVSREHGIGISRFDLQIAQIKFARDSV